MLIALQILVRTLGLVGCAAVLSACGQRGPLFLPAEAAAANRATLPQTLVPGRTADQKPASTLPSASPAPTTTP